MNLFFTNVQLCNLYFNKHLDIFLSRYNFKTFSNWYKRNRWINKKKIKCHIIETSDPLIMWAASDLKTKQKIKLKSVSIYLQLWWFGEMASISDRTGFKYTWVTHPIINIIIVIHGHGHWVLSHLCTTYSHRILHIGMVQGFCSTSER